MCRKWIYLACLLILLGLPQAGVTNAADGSLVGWWKLDETSGTIAHDSSGYGNVGTLRGDPQWTAGTVGGALQFDGDGDYVDCGDGASLNITGELTIAAWIKLAGPVTDRKIAGNQDGITGGYKLGVYSDLLEFEIRTANNEAFLNRNAGGGMMLQPELWHHVVGVYSQGDYIRTYVDGNVDREMFTPELLGTSTGTFKFGREPFSDSYFWFGLIDDVRVYDRALGQEEIQDIMRTGEIPPATGPDPANGAILFPDTDPQVTLTWVPGVGTVLYDIYFGTDYSVVADADPTTPGVYLGRTEANSYELFALERGGIYYWRVDVIGPDGTINRGEIWNFKIPRPIEPDEQLIRNYTPAGWQAEDVQWGRDVDPHNKIDDIIDRSDANSFDVVVNYKRAVQDGDIDFLNSVGAQSKVQMRLKYLSSVAVGGLNKDDIFAIAGDPDVAFIEQQFGFAPALNFSVPGICVSPAAGGCATTVPTGTDGSGINIAIIDTGVDNAVHSAFPTSHYVAGYDATTTPGTLADPDDDEGHGTHVASIALGQATVNTSRGVAPGAGLVDVRVLTAAGGTWPQAADGLQTVYDNRNTWGIGVINMSIIQTDAFGNPIMSEGLDAFSQLVDLAESMGIVVVAAVGNNGPANTVLATPAAATRAITVAACNVAATANRADDTMASMSSRGPRSDDNDADQNDELKPEVTAPGANNDMTINDDDTDADTLACVRITSAVAAGTGVTINVTSSDDITAGEMISLFDGASYNFKESIVVATSAGAGGTSFTATTTLPHPVSTLVAETGIFAARHNTTNEGIRKSGTSMAAPHVAGLAALIMDARTGINAASVKDLIISTAELPAGTPASPPGAALGWNNAWGWGLVNASAAINLATQTDLTFPSHPPSPGWLSPDISHTQPLKVGQAATVTVKIRNNGPNPANNVRIHFGVHVFSAATPTFYDIATEIVNIPVNPTGNTAVSTQWVPLAASHQCLKVEIGYSPDTDYSNNYAQRNVKVALSPVQLRVRNTLTEDPARVDFVAKLEYPDAGWTYRIDPPFVTLAAGDPPAEIEAELYPPDNALPGEQQMLHVAAVIDTNLVAIELGGISVQHTVSGCLVLDDFENYTDYKPNRIFDLWKDGRDDPGNGAMVGHPDADPDAGEHFVETTIVHGGNQSMPYYYDNSAGYSEATMTLSPLRDWTVENIDVLSLWFHGDPANDPEPMYVAVANSTGTLAVVYHEDPSATQIDNWTEWRINLQVFADHGVNLVDIDNIAIGFGSKFGVGGKGKVYFDDILLCPAQTSL